MAGNFAEFGAETTGPRIAIEDEQLWRGKEAQIAETLGRIAAQPGARAHTEAQTRGLNAEAALKEQQAAEAEQLRKLAQQAGMPLEGEEGDDLPTVTSRLATTLFSKGLVKQGLELAGKADQALLRRAQVGTQVAQQELTGLRMQGLQAQRVASIAGSVVDQASWDNARTLGTAEGLDFSAFPADFAAAQPMVRQLAQAGMTVYQQSQRDLAEREAKQKKALSDARIAAAKNRVQESTARIALLKTREQHLIKNGDADSAALRDVRKTLAEWNKVRTESARLAKERPATQSWIDRISEKAAIPQAPTSPIMRRDGVIYDTPQGPLRWDATGGGWDDPTDDDDDDED